MRNFYPKFNVTNGLKMIIALRLASFFLIFAVCFRPTFALENGLARTPPMGWISWERFTNTVDCQEYPNDCLNDQLIKQMAGRLVGDGYAKLGYNYINIDDCWSEMQRQQVTNDLVADRSRFPNGIKALAEFVHQKGLKFGIYGDCGTKTCAGYPAQLKTTTNLEDNYFDQDAKLFADWEVDSLKFDGCYLDAEKQPLICPKMAHSLSQTKRPILLICEYPFYMLQNELAPDWTQVGESCNAWRYFDDIEDSWLSVLRTIDYTISLQTTIIQHHGPGKWFDPDQIVVGNFALSEDQARAQMAIWCLWSAPLYMSNDLRSISNSMAAILKNEKLIQVDQDKLGLFGLMVGEKQDKKLQAFVKIVEPIRFGCPSFVIVYLNRNTLGNWRRVGFNLRSLLKRMPIKLAADRQESVYISQADKTFDPIVADKCKNLINSAMTRRSRKKDTPTDLLVKPVQTSTNKIPENDIPLEEKEVRFEVEDLFGDKVESEISLDSTLELNVNPSGVRAVKLTIKEVD